MLDSHLDFETRGVVDLPKAGAHVYAADPQTEPLCAAWAVGEEPIALWQPGDPPPERLFAHMAAGGRIVAHNANFEIAIWSAIMAPRFGWPATQPRQWKCTLAMAAAMSLPLSLENCAAALGLEIRKDGEGRKLMMKMAKPLKYDERGRPIWFDTLEARKRLGEYCLTDVAVERALTKRLMDLSPAEQRIWELNARINGRGLQIDTVAVRAAAEIAEVEKVRLGAELSRVTDGAVTAVSQAARLLEWAKTQGVDLAKLAKAELTEALSAPDLPPLVRRALEIRREGAKTSTAKLRAMTVSVNADGRARGCFMHHGAHTGRETARRIQPANLPRPELLTQSEIEGVMDFLSQPEDPFA